jgi:hypothetical protein
MLKTAHQLRNQARKLDRRARKAEAVIELMRTKGCALHLQFVAGNPHWFLTDGTVVTTAVAASIILRTDVVDVGDALPFPGARAQTFRLAERGRLPNRRRAETIKLRFGGQKAAYHITVGYYADDRLGEIFILTRPAARSRRSLTTSRC